MPPRRRTKPSVAQRVATVRSAIAPTPRLNAATVDLAVELGTRRTLRLERPVVIASGPLGFGAEARALVDLRDVGAFVTRTVTLTARRAGLPPRLVEVPGGLLHAIDRENPGIDEVLQRHGAAWRSAPCVIVLSLAASESDELQRLVRKVEGRSEELGVDAYELDLTAPCAALSGAAWESSIDEVARAVDAARAKSDLPIVAKISPQAADITKLMEHLADAGADVVSISGSPVGFLPDRARRGSALAAGSGRLSGPLIRPLALAAVVEAAAVGTLPIIGGGGIGSPADALDFLVAGAAAVSVGSAIWADPSLPGAIADSVRRAAASRGAAQVGALVGAAVRGQTEKGARRSGTTPR